jgi:hypothetical protein
MAVHPIPKGLVMVKIWGPDQILFNKVYTVGLLLNTNLKIEIEKTTPS